MNKKRLQQSGVALVELALLLPIVASLWILSSELVFIMGAKEKMSSFNREGGNVALRDCGPLASPSSCLNTTRATLMSFTSPYLVNPDFNLTIVRYDPVTLAVTFYQSLGAQPSHFNQAQFQGGSTRLTDLVVNNEMVVICETFVPYQPVTFNFNLGVLYEVTLF